jgi:integral membrane protein (TIGR01906 family)
MSFTKPWAVALAHALLVVAVPILLIATPLYLYISPAWAGYEYGRAAFPPSSRFTDAERLRLSTANIDYLRGTVSRQELADLRTDAGEVAMRAEEVQHMTDVKGVTDGFFVAHGLALLAAVLAIIVVWRSPRRGWLYLYLRQGIWIVGALMLLILASSFIDFDTFFTRFHQIFFSAGSWLFWEEDTLIQLYPLPFWTDTVAKLAVTILVEAGILYFVTTRLPHDATL